MFWDIVPYVTIAILVVGTWWRYRYDKFGWTTRSSQLYESRLLRIGSPLFHFGILVVIFGHVIGLLIPESLDQRRRVEPDTAITSRPSRWAASPGIATLVGAAILVYRRRTKGPVFMATTRNDKLMYAVLILAIIAGLATTLIGSGLIGEEHNYRETVSVWFRSIFILQPDGEAMTHGAVVLPDPRPDRHGAVRALAVHPAGARLQRAHRLPVPALHRLPLPWCRPARRTHRIRATPPGVVGNVQLLRMPGNPDDREAQRRTRRHRQQHLRTAGGIA